MSQKPSNTPEPGEADKANGTAMVVVGCKLPNGLICEMGKVGDDGYRRVVLKGANDAKIVGGFGFTDVSKDFWEAWMKKHQRLEFVRKGMVFVHGDQASAAAHAEERANVRSGFEPLDPFKKQHNAKGEVILEVDPEHFSAARKAAGEAGAIRARG